MSAVCKVHCPAIIEYCCHEGVFLVCNNVYVGGTRQSYIYMNARMQSFPPEYCREHTDSALPFYIMHSNAISSPVSPVTINALNLESSFIVSWSSSDKSRSQVSTVGAFTGGQSQHGHSVPLAAIMYCVSRSNFSVRSNQTGQHWHHSGLAPSPCYWFRPTP